MKKGQKVQISNYRHLYQRLQNYKKRIFIYRIKQKNYKNKLKFYKPNWKDKDKELVLINHKVEYQTVNHVANPQHQT